MFEIFIEHTFAAAHFLRDYKGKCENLHGHNYKVQVGVAGNQLAPNGLLYDFTDLKQKLRATAEYMDHKCLNEIMPFDVLNPSAENIAKFIFDEIQRGLAGQKLSFVRVWETDTSCAEYRPAV